MNAPTSFQLIRSQPISSLKLTIHEYEHPASGATHYHLEADNQENVFLVGLRTVPTDSTGVAHILEHTVLCGSEKFPVRDPFFMMLRRSLNTFMNAFTSSDWTAYPFASQNRKDYFNLLDVYLDAVFFARLDPLDFAQEGHRVEFAESGNPESDLVFKGVVFNEMKGAMSSPVSVLWQSLSEHLFPTTTYHYNSGGEPENIPDLSYQELLDFYRAHYRPDNAIFMTYGDIPAAEIQARIEESVLKRFEASDKTISVPFESRYEAPVQITESYVADETDDNKAHHVVGWLLGPATDLQGMLEANLLANVLLNDSASPLRHALESSDLGHAPSPLCGLEDSMREMVFACGLEGVDADNKEAITDLVISVLKDVADKGVPLAQLEAVLHQLELHQREIQGDSYPYGLQLILGGLSTAIHRGDPVAVLNLDDALSNIQESIQDPEYIKGLARRLLLENPHRVDLTMVPDSGLDERRQEAERSRLQAIKSQMDAEQQQRVVELASQLEVRQGQVDDESILPKVGIEDVPASKRIPLPVRDKQGSPAITTYGQGTNGLVYQQCIVSLPQLDSELLQIMPLYNLCMTELGAGQNSYLEMQAWQTAISGGLHASMNVRGDILNVQDVSANFVLSGKALCRNHQPLTELMHTTFEQIRFDEHERIAELVSHKRARAEQSVTGSGHALAMGAAASGMSPVAAMNFKLSGLLGIQNLKALDDQLKQDSKHISKLADKLNSIHDLVLSAPREYLLIGDPTQIDRYETILREHWAYKGQVKTSIGAADMFSLDPVGQQIKQLWTTTTQVNFCAKAYPTVPVEHPDAPALSVLAEVLRNGFLHRAIREQGGAYGGGASQDSANANFRFYSYRDPRLQETLDDFDQAIAWLLETEHEDRALEEAILGVISGLDKPGSPAGEAKSAFHNTWFGRTPEQRLGFRRAVLAVTIDDLKRVTETYLKPELASVAVLTRPTEEEELAGFDGFDIHEL